MTATSGINRRHENPRRAGKTSGRNNRRLLPALIAGSACGLIAGPVSALQLGDLEVQSTLGQPLRASIAFALNPNEQLFDHCIRLGSGKSPDGLPRLNNTSLSVANGTIMLTGTSPLREPMLAVQITVNCSYTANLTRSYTVMLDPARHAAKTVVDEPVAVPVSATPLINRDRASVVPSGETVPIPLSTTYTVRVGDTLSGIATRIENRPIGLWPAVNAIFIANPHAFINGDINLMKAGSQIAIPSLDNVTAPVLSSNEIVPEPVAAIAETTSATSGVYPGYVAEARATATAAQSATQPSVELINEIPSNETTLTEITDTSFVTSIQPGDISVGADAAFVSPVETNSAESTIEPLAASAEPQLPTPVSTRDLGTNDNWSWMFWLAGSGIALILGLLLFGRSLRARFGSVAVGAAAEPLIRDDDETARNEALSEVDFPIQDTNSAQGDYVLDADLGAGTGLNDSADIDVAEDFGFSSNGEAESELDMVLPEESGQEADTQSTDIIPPRRVEEASILVEEKLPGADDEYDLSMIVDATKQYPGDDASTEKDLQAVPFDMASDEDFDVDCTLDNQFSLDTLEQDYEDELTATHAANLEIEKAAAELTLRLTDAADDKTTEMPSGDLTAEMSTAELTAEMPTADITAEITSEVTVQMPGTAAAENEEFSKLDDTGFNDELTAQMPATEGDATTEMVVESAIVNTRKSTG